MWHTNSCMSLISFVLKLYSQSKGHYRFGYIDVYTLAKGIKTMVLVNIIVYEHNVVFVK